MPRRTRCRARRRRSPTGRAALLAAEVRQQHADDLVPTRAEHLPQRAGRRYGPRWGVDGVGGATRHGGADDAFAHAGSLRDDGAPGEPAARRRGGGSGRCAWPRGTRAVRSPSSRPTPGLLEPAPLGLGQVGVVVVIQDGAVPESAGDPLDPAGVGGPDGPGEAVDGVVGDARPPRPRCGTSPRSAPARRTRPARSAIVDVHPSRTVAGSSGRRARAGSAGRPTAPQHRALRHCLRPRTAWTLSR